MAGKGSALVAKSEHVGGTPFSPREQRDQSKSEQKRREGKDEAFGVLGGGHVAFLSGSLAAAGLRKRLASRP